MTIYEKIKNLREKNNMTQEELAKKLGYKSRSTINKIEKGLRDINQSQVLCFAKALNTTPAYLMGWEEKTEENKPKKKVYKIPVYGEIAAGIPIDAIEDIIDYEEVDEHTFNRGELIALKIRGDSMEPRICNGDVVIIRLQNDIESGELAAVLINGDSATLKKIKKDKKGIYLIPFNNDYETVFYSNDEILELPITIIGKVIELRGKF